MHMLRRLLERDELRLFVALDLPAPRARGAGGVPRGGGRSRVWRPVPDEALHVTLAFLGHRPEADVDAIADVLPSAPMHAPRLALGRRRSLLPPRRPRVLTAEVEDPHGSLAALQARGQRRPGGAAALHARGAAVPPARHRRAAAARRAGAAERGAPGAGSSSAARR